MIWAVCFVLVPKAVAIFIDVQEKKWWSLKYEDEKKKKFFSTSFLLRVSLTWFYILDKIFKEHKRELFLFYYSPFHFLLFSFFSCHLFHLSVIILSSIFLFFSTFFRLSFLPSVKFHETIVHMTSLIQYTYVWIWN